jgi:hypothetical protein
MVARIDSQRRRSERRAADSHFRAGRSLGHSVLDQLEYAPDLLGFIHQPLRFAAPFLAAADRLTEYEIATACFTGVPDLTSRRMFSRKAFADELLMSGMV